MSCSENELTYRPRGKEAADFHAAVEWLAAAWKWAASLLSWTVLYARRSPDLEYSTDLRDTTLAHRRGQPEGDRQPMAHSGARDDRGRLFIFVVVEQLDQHEVLVARRSLEGA